MPRPPMDPKARRVPVSARLDPELYAWAEKRVGPGKPYHTFTHLMERALETLREVEEGGVSAGVRVKSRRR